MIFFLGFSVKLLCINHICVSFPDSANCITCIYHFHHNWYGFFPVFQIKLILKIALIIMIIVFWSLVLLNLLFDSPWKTWGWIFPYLQWFQDAKKKLSARMNRLDRSLDECAALTETTREEVCKEFRMYNFGFLLFLCCLIIVSSVIDQRNTTGSRYNKWRFQVCSCCCPCSGKSIARILLFP